jgi:hypothetical protein
MGQQTADPSLRLKATAGFQRREPRASPDVFITQDAARHDKDGWRLDNVHGLKLARTVGDRNGGHAHGGQSKREARGY